jgi:peptidyl-dipeptidase Dcp
VEETTLSTAVPHQAGRGHRRRRRRRRRQGKLAGLSDGDLAAAEAAKARKLDGKFLLPLQNTTQQPVLAR